MRPLGIALLTVWTVAVGALTGCSEEGTIASPAATGDGGSGAAPEASTGGGRDAGSDARDDASTAPGEPTLLSLVVSTGALRPAFDPTVTDYDITSINALYTLQVTAKAADPAARVTIHGLTATSGVATTTSLQPRENLDVTVEPAGGGAPRTYRVHYVPSDMPTWSVSSSSSAGTGPVLLLLLSTSGTTAGTRSWSIGPAHRSTTGDTRRRSSSRTSSR